MSKAKITIQQPTHITLTVHKEATKIREADTRDAEALLGLIARRKARISEDFYEIGRALRDLLKKKLHLALGYASFKEMLQKRDVMSVTAAKKLIAIVSSVPVEKALSLGVEKAYALSRYTAATPEPDSPALLLDSGAEVGGKKVTEATVRDLTRAVQSVNAKTKPARKASPEEAAATKAARALTAWLRSHKITGATASAKRSGKTYRLILDLPLSASAALLAIGK